MNPVDRQIRQGHPGRQEVLPAPMGRVAPGHGGLAEHTVLLADRTVAKPGEICFPDAATIPVAGAAACDVTHQIELEAGQSLLINGAGGGVGPMATQIGRVHKFTVLGVASAAKKERPGRRRCAPCRRSRGRGPVPRHLDRRRGDGA